ncbi:MAG: VCBS domain-containing protein, partial [Chlorobium sp.]|nr:VCBS domain-containing protein [Chlorobium sp.]
DGQGGSVECTVSVTVTGTNDAPVIGAGSFIDSVTEIGDLAAGENTTDLVASGSFAISDVDLTNTQSVAAVAADAGYLGTFTPSVTDQTTTDGTGTIGWNFTVADSAIDHLAADETLTQTYAVTVTDTAGATATKNVVITINGMNDAPIVEATNVTGVVTEMDTTPVGDLTSSGTISFTDADLIDVHSISVVTASAGALGMLMPTITTDTTGSGLGGVVTWNYSVAASAVEYLAEGEHKVETFTFSVLDGHGGSVERTVSVTITGTNDDTLAPTLTGSTPTDNAAAVAVGSDIVLTFDEAVQAGIGNIVISNDNGDIRTIAITDSSQVTMSDDTVTINPTDNLQAGSNYHVQLARGVIEDMSGNAYAGISDATTLNFATFENSAPIVEVTGVTGGVTELITPVDDLTESGTIGFTDADLTDAHSVSSVTASAGALGTLTPTITTDTIGTGLGGVLTWNYSVSSTAVEYLAEGEQKVETFTFSVLDGHGGSVDRTVSVTITGTNDGPVIGLGLFDGSVTELADLASGENTTDLVASGSFAISDVDLTNTQSVAAVAADTGYLGTFTPSVTDQTTTDGTGTIGWNFTVADSAIDHLAAGETLTQTYTVTVTDTAGATATNDVVITITGTYDDTLAPTLTGSTPTDNAATVAVGSDIVLTFSEPVQAGTGNIVISNGTDIRTISVTDSQVTINDSTVTINPTGNLNAGSNYYVQIENGAIKDMAGNAYEGISDTTTLDFATIPPLDQLLNGDGSNNVLNGGAGNDTLNGGAGNDTMQGGAGNDLYVVDSTGDVVTENSEEGIDTVQSSISYILGANVESLTLTGTGAINGTGNALDNLLLGNSGNNSLNGGAGNDTLNGGAGNDGMQGGLGNDTYVVDSISDVVTEAASAGMDTVQSSVSYTLGANVENLALMGTGAINGTGNTLDNLLTGNSGNNSLNGGAGNDTMQGGAGNDTYVVDSATDVVTENEGEGTDTVHSSLSYTLGENVENLTLTGAGVITGTGNALDNILLGNSANNT